MTKLILPMIQNLKNYALGNGDDFELEHRCYNGVCLTAGVGCLAAGIFNTVINMPALATIATLVIGLIYLWLYSKSRQEDEYTPVLWIYILCGVILLVITWFFNGGINGSDTFVSMVALVAMTVVLKSQRCLVAAAIFFPTMSALFLIEYLYPDLIVGYSSQDQRFLDIYLAFAVSTVVIYSIISLILESHGIEKNRLHTTNVLLQEKMDILNRTNLDLEEALARVKTLSGLLPICSSCKKVRDDKGYWNRIESYIQKHSKAEFSHSICPECSEMLYPDLDLNRNNLLNTSNEEDESE